MPFPSSNPSHCSNLIGYFICSHMILPLLISHLFLNCFETSDFLKSTSFLSIHFCFLHFGRKFDSLQGVATYFTILFIFSEFHQKWWSFQKKLLLFLVMSVVLDFDVVWYGNCNFLSLSFMVCDQAPLVARERPYSSPWKILITLKIGSPSI